MKIRGLNEEEILKLNRLAAQKGVSREEYLRQIVRAKLVQGEVASLENKYENLVKTVCDVIEHNTEQLEEISNFIRGEKEHDS